MIFNNKRRAVSSFLMYPFIIMIVLDLYGLGLNSNSNLSQQGSLVLTGASPQLTNSTSTSTCAGLSDVQCLAKFFPACKWYDITCVVDQNLCKISNNLQFCQFLGLGSSGFSTNGLPLNNGIPLLSIIGFSSNPFTNPWGFVITILVVVGVISLAGTSILGTSFLNAGTAYILFMSVTLILTWSALLGAGQPLFNTFPCYDYATQGLISCAGVSGSTPVTSTVVNTGFVMQMFFTLAVFIGIIDEIAI